MCMANAVQDKPSNNRRLVTKNMELINMEGDTEKITLRVPTRYLRAIDFLVKADDFPSRSEAIRSAVRDMIYERVELVPEKIRKMQEVEMAIAEAEALEKEITR